MGSSKVSTAAKTSATKSSGSKSKGLRFDSKFVGRGENPYAQIKWTKRSSQITDSGGRIVFAMDAVEVPESWSQLATDIAVSKYFRKAGVPKTGHETSVRQLVHRIAHTIRTSGENFGDYFASSEDAEQFEKELVQILLTQKGAFNSPVWFNLGLFHEYGVIGSGGNFAWDFELNRAVETENSFERPQCSACFIQSVDDDLMSIFDLVKNEARIFKFGSGTGTNFSKIRGSMEKLSGGGTSSGLMSFLEVLDRGAGATKSGGTTRRAAKMVSLDIDHPEIVDFIQWKSREEKKVAALAAAGYSSDFNGEAYRTVGGQNSNNSVRVSDEFMKAVERDGEWSTTARTDGGKIATYKARELWRIIGQAAWDCADPGLQFDSTIQKWHTCPDTGRINGSNPCSEYMFLDDSACNLSSLNLVKFLNDDGTFDSESYRHAARILFTAQEILVDLSSYPTERIARNSHDYRPLGLGYANLGTLLMIKGIAYDSEAAVAWAGALTALMHGEAFRTSTELAAAKGPFAGYARNSASMMKVMKQHQAAATDIPEGFVPKAMLSEVRKIWSEVVERGADVGFRNAQATVLAPTGTIGLLMDCDTTGIEPDFALVKFKKLAGGGYFKIVNQSVPRALKALGYNEKQVSEIVRYAVGTMSLDGAPYVNSEVLRSRGLNEVDLQKISSALTAAFDLNSAVAPWVIGAEGMARLGFTEDELKGKSILGKLGFSSQQVKDASRIVCGSMTVEGAPHLKKEHLAVFDCANKCGPDGVRFLSPVSHIKMMAAAQPFLSGAISKTVNLPFEATIEEIEKVYMDSWKLGLKAVAVYRDGSKHSQVLNQKDKKIEASAGVNERGETLAYSQEDLEQAVASALALAPPRKRKMPQRRDGLTIESRVGGHQVFLRTGEYDDGRIGEIFIDMHKEGATLRSLLNCFAISVSMGLQYGVPLEDYVDKFTFTRFEPYGLVDHPNIKTATSLLDYIFRVLGMEYLGKTDFVHVKPALDDLRLRNAAQEDRSSSEPQQMDLAIERAVVPNARSNDEGSVVSEGGVAKVTRYSTVAADPLDAQLSNMMGDAPMCTTCGHVTVRNGSCYRCLNCGNSMGCS
jgi:ribonucleoside-diphosphate reductase alpha chain